MKLNILGTTWTVKEVTKKQLCQNIGADEPGEEAFAGWDDLSQTIWLRNDIEKDSRLEKLFHEIGEVIMRELSLSFVDIQDDDQAHDLWTIFCRVYFATLVDNGFVNLKSVGV